MGKLTKLQIATDLYLYFNLMVEARRNGKVTFGVLFEDICKKNGVAYSKELFDEVLAVSKSTNLINAMGVLKDMFIDSFAAVDQNSYELDFLVACLTGDEADKNYWDSKRVSFIKEIRNAICHSDEHENYTMNEDGSIDIDSITKSGIPLKVHLTSDDLLKICNFLSNYSRRNRVWRIFCDGKDVNLGDLINGDKEALVQKLCDIKIVRLQSKIDSPRLDVFANGGTLDVEHIGSYLGNNMDIQADCFYLIREQCEDIANQIYIFKSRFPNFAGVFANMLLFSNLEYPDFKVERLFYEAFKTQFISENGTYGEFISFLTKDYFDFCDNNGQTEVFRQWIRSANVEPKQQFVMLYEDYVHYPYNELTNYLNYVCSNLNFNGKSSDDRQRHLRNAFMHKRLSYLKTMNVSDDPYICLFDNSDDVNKPKSLDNAKWTDVIFCSEAISFANQIVKQHSLSNAQQQSGGSKK